MKQLLSIVIPSLFLFMSCTANQSENNTSTRENMKDWSQPIVHYHSASTPLRANEFIPNINDTISQELKVVLYQILNNMIYVEGGSFLMGEPLDSNAENQSAMPQFEEIVGNFYLGRYEVTQEEYSLIMGTSCNAYYPDPKRPVENISWVDGYNFMEQLKELTGLPFRYPTEEEWEYAARGGNKSMGYKYIGSDQFDETTVSISTMEEEPQLHTLPVGQLAPNELGFYDMGGNVWEFTENDWRPDYVTEADNSWKVIRGGSFRSIGDQCHAFLRSNVRADWKASNIGMRLAL